MAVKVCTNDCEHENEKCEKIYLDGDEGVYLNEGDVGVGDLLCGALQFGHVSLKKTFLLID